MADSTYINSLGARAELDTGSGKAFYFRLEKLAEDGLGLRRSEGFGRVTFSDLLHHQANERLKKNQEVTL